MSVDRPTFNESWHRVAGLRCRLRPGVRIVRQRYRGHTWHVLHDAAAGQYFRLSEPAYALVGLLDGRRTVAEARNAVAERLADLAPTQGEVVDVLGRLYTGNLLAGELPGDAQAVLARARKRVAREVRGHLANFLFLRIPLIDPDRWLTNVRPLVSWIFSWFGLALWLAILAVGAWHLAGREQQLFSAAQDVLAPDNLIPLYAMFALLKLAHELAHAFACKVYGVREGGGRTGAGEVRSMGVMLMVLMPVPYVDASSSWMLRSKRRRCVVAAAGMMAELALAAVAAVVWSTTPEGSTAHALAFNAMLTAGVSTIIFNANPLLRYDGYYILSDLIEIPNLAQRSNNFVHYLVKRRVWGVRRAIDPSTTPGERAWFLAYWPASLVYRTIVFAGIIMFLAEQWFVVGMLLAAFGIVTWLVLPAARFVRYLASAGELARVRVRAWSTSIAAALLLAAGVGAVPLPDRVRLEGVVEPEFMEVLHARADGEIAAIAPSGNRTDTIDAPVRLDNPEYLARRRQLAAQAERLRLAHVQALEGEPAVAQHLAAQVQAVREQLRFADDDLSRLSVRPVGTGVWIAPAQEPLIGAYTQRGSRLGIIAELDRLVVRAMATQDRAARIVQAETPHAELRVRGRPEQRLDVATLSIRPAGQDHLPSRALGYAVGGTIETDPSDAHGQRTREPVFEVRLGLDPGAPLLPGQRVVVRFDLDNRPLAAQAWDHLRRTLQRRLRL